MESIATITKIHRQLCERWHSQPVDSPHEGLLGIVCQQFGCNFLLWHEEDIARSRDVTAEKIAEVKRAIDGYNQKRNDYIEKIDDWITEELGRQGIAPQVSARQNTETAGSAIEERPAGTDSRTPACPTACSRAGAVLEPCPRRLQLRALVVGQLVQHSRSRLRPHLSQLLADGGHLRSQCLGQVLVDGAVPAIGDD
jgi:hypothetical protein